MDKMAVPMGVKYVGFVASPALKAQVASEAAKLSRFRDQLEYVTLQVGRWHLHHNQGHLYRVTLDVDLGKRAHPLAVVEESDVGADATAVPTLLDDAFGTAARQLSAIFAPAH